MRENIYLSLKELEAGLDEILRAPKDGGSLELIVRRPGPGLREAVEKGELSPEQGLDGDGWKARGSSRTPDRAADPETQLTIMSSRVVSLLAGSRDRWQLAGDQLFLDLDLSAGNLPPGTRLSVGQAVIEVTAPPHTGCKKFSEWFGPDAVKFINSAEGKKLRLRGLHAKVVKAGSIAAGNMVRKL